VEKEDTEEKQLKTSATILKYEGVMGNIRDTPSNNLGKDVTDNKRRKRNSGVSTVH